MKPTGLNPIPQGKSVFQRHLETWQDGCGAMVCESARKKVSCRGVLPCDIAFVGEAPGVSENILGKPFAGPAGHLLDDIVSRALHGVFRCAFMNLMACIPLDETGTKATEPEIADIKSCKPRLIELIRIAKPRIIVHVGELPKKHCPTMKELAPVDWLPEHQTAIHFTHIVHPAYILRLNVAMQGLAVRRCIVALETAADLIT